MPRGTKVGQAYVKILADGVGMDREIERELGDIEFREYGVARGKEFSEGFIDRFGYDLRKGWDDAFKNAGPELQKSLDKELSKVRIIEREVDKIASSDVIQNLARKVGADYGDAFTESVEARVRGKLAQAVQDGAKIKSLPKLTFKFTDEAIDELDRLRVEQERIYSQLLFEQNKFDLKQIEDAKAKAEKQSVAQKKADAAKLKAADALRAKEAADELRDRKKRDNEFKSYLRDLENRYNKATQIVGTATREQRKAIKALQNEIKTLGQTFNQADFSEDIGTRFIKFQQQVTSGRGGLRNYANSIDVIADRNARAFGKGSRSDIINFFGSLTGNLSRLPAVGLRAISFIGDLGRELKNFKELPQTIAAGGSAFGQLGRSLGAAATGALILVPIMAVLVTIMSSLLAIVTALANVIAFSLVGAVGILGGAFAAIAVGVGAAVLAFKNLSDQQKELLSNSFDPVVKTFRDLGREIAGPLSLAFETIGAQVNSAFQGLEPLARQLGAAFGFIGIQFSSMLNGPGFQLFLQSLRDYLPNILVNLGGAFSEFFGGVSATLAAIMPSVERFSVWLNKIATEFNEWASSAEGQTSIQDFFKRAEDSLKSLGGFLGEVGGLLSDLLFNAAGNDVGKNIFDDLTNAVENFRNYIADGKIEKWFERGQKLADELGKAFKKIGQVIDALDNSAVLDAIVKGFDALIFIIDQLMPTIELVLSLFGLLEGVLKLLKGDVDGFKDAFGDFTSAMIGFIDSLLGPIDELVGALGGAIAKLAEFIGLKAKAVAGEITGPGQLGQVSPNSVTPRGLTAGRQSALTSGLLSGVQSAGRKAGNDVAQTYSKGAEKGVKEGSKKLSASLRKQATKYLKDALSINPKTYIAGLIKSINSIPAELRNQTAVGVKELAEQIVSDAQSQVDSAYDALRSAAEQLLDNNTKANRAAFKRAKKAYKKEIKELNNAIAASNSLLKNTLSIQPLQVAFGDIAKDLSKALSTITDDGGGAGVLATLSDFGEQFRDAAAQLVEDAQGAVTDAFEGLLGATTKREVRRAKKILANANAELQKAIKAYGNSKVVENILNQQSQLTNAAAGLFDANGNAITKTYEALAAGLSAQNATLADYAEARLVLAGRIEEGTRKLEEAISLRDGFRDQIADSIRSFGSLLNAQAETLNGVQGQITSDNIISTLKDRLARIKEFAKNLNTLVGRGLSDDVYKQLVEAGPEAGADYVSALVAGGIGAVNQVNNLSSQIGAEADKLGEAASNRLYQAGVDSAQGFLDGLLSLDKELEKAAEGLGLIIANSIKKTLGIASPSKVMEDITGNVKQTLIDGLDSAVSAVASAASRLGDSVSVGVASPNISSTSTQTTPAAGKVIDMSGWQIQTDTSDPEAVAHEVLNDVIAKLL